MLDERARPLEPRRDARVAVVGRALLGVVHRDLAHEGALALREADLREQLGGVRVHGAEVRRRGRAVREQGLHEGVVAAAREAEIGVAGLEREGAGAQPRVERQVERLAQLRPLRRVDVQIDEAGQQQLGRRELEEMAAAASFLPQPHVVAVARGPHGRDVARRIHGDEGVLDDLEGAARRGVRERPPDRHAARVAGHGVILAAGAQCRELRARIMALGGRRQSANGDGGQARGPAQPTRLSGPIASSGATLFAPGRG